MFLGMGNRKRMLTFFFFSFLFQVGFSACVVLLPAQRYPLLSHLREGEERGKSHVPRTRPWGLVWMTRAIFSLFIIASLFVFHTHTRARTYTSLSSSALPPSFPLPYIYTYTHISTTPHPSIRPIPPYTKSHNHETEERKKEIITHVHTYIKTTPHPSPKKNPPNPEKVKHHTYTSKCTILFCSVLNSVDSD